jgi:hypothetical protein
VTEARTGAHPSPVLRTTIGPAPFAVGFSTFSVRKACQVFDKPVAVQTAQSHRFQAGDRSRCRRVPGAHPGPRGLGAPVLRAMRNEVRRRVAPPFASGPGIASRAPAARPRRPRGRNPVTTSRPSSGCSQRYPAPLPPSSIRSRTMSSPSLRPRRSSQVLAVRAARIVRRGAHGERHRPGAVRRSERDRDAAIDTSRDRVLRLLHP